jgi:uncharacterized protein involved in exopolysaccharide biosynthesis
MSEFSRNKARAESGAKASSQPQPERNDLAVDLLSILSRRKWLIVASAIFGLLAGGMYFFLTPPTFESRAQVLVMQNDSAAMAAQTNVGQAAVSEDLLSPRI